MSYVLDHLSAAEREAIARDSFQVTEQRGDELHGLCPFHGENKPSFSYNIAKDLCNCFSCGATGDLISLWGQSRGYVSNDSAFAAFRDQYGPTPAHGNTRPARIADSQPGGRFANGGQGGTTEETRYIPETDYTSLEQLSGELLEKAHNFGWNDTTINKLGIRQRGDRIAIPIRQDDDQIVNIRLYAPGAAENKIISWGKGYGKNKLYPNPGSWKKTGPILICEGEKDTITAISKGFNAVTQTAGCNSWADQFTRFFTRRDVIIAYDADEKGHTGAQKVAKKLAEVAKSVKIITWPTDIMPMVDDHGQDLTDYFSAHGHNAQDLKDLISATKTETIQRSNSAENTDVQRFFGGERGKQFRPRLVADEILTWRRLIHEPKSGIIYTWQETHWSEYDPSNIRRQILTMLEEEGTTPRTNDILTIVRDLSNIEQGRQMNDKQNNIPIRNGIFDLETFQIHDHEPENLNNYIIDIELDLSGELPTCPLWQQFLIQAISDQDTITELQKFFGYCLTRETRYEKALLLIGPGGDGKGTILKILQALVGEPNTANVTMSGLQDQFHRVMLVDKLLNVATEVEAGLLQSDIFKTLISGESVTAAYKHKNAFSFLPVCKLAFSANKHPNIQDTSDGLYRRLLVIEMEKQFVKQGKADLYLFDKLLQELPGIFMWSLRGLQRLREEGFKLSDYMLACLDKFQAMNDPLVTFVEEHIEPDANGFETKTDLYAAYNKYCNQSGYRPKGKNTFLADLARKVPGAKETRENYGARRRGYAGLRLVEK